MQELSVISRRTWRAALLLVVMAVFMSGLTAGCGRSAKSGSALTVYTVSGLSAWYTPLFEKFTKDTGIAVNVFEGGSGELVSRVNSPAVWDHLGTDKPVPPADLLITLPPFIQKAGKAGLLQASGADIRGIPAGLVGPDATYVPIAGTALCFIANPGFIANPALNQRPVSWGDLLNPGLKGKLQYSTPGEAGDGTALLILLKHLMGKQRALDYFAALRSNNVGPASSTGKLQPKVDSGELLVANGDVQMNLASINNDGSKFDIFFPAMPDGSRATVSLPYMAGVTVGSKLPGEAKSLLAALLSDDAQKSLYSTAFGMPVRDSIAAQVTGRPGVKTPQDVLAGVTLWQPDWNTVLAELEADIASYRKATS